MRQINDKVQSIIDFLRSGMNKIGKVNIENVVVNHTFHDAAVSPGDGVELIVGDKKTLTIEIYGSSTSRKINFYAKGDSDTLRPLIGINLSTFELGTSTTGNGELWQFDITGLKSVIMQLESVTAGDVTVKGKVVA